MIDEINIDTDERGFSLALTGDFTEECDAYLAGLGSRLTLRLPQDAALALLKAALAEIGPWAMEMETERRAYENASPEERARVLNHG